MKRSEMVDKVVEFLNLCFEGKDNPGRRRTASALVDLFENHLPVPIKWDKETDDDWQKEADNRYGAKK